MVKYPATTANNIAAIHQGIGVADSGSWQWHMQPRSLHAASRASRRIRDLLAARPADAPTTIPAIYHKGELTMKNLALLAVFLSLPLFGQTPAPNPATNSTTFTISANVVSLPAGGVTSAATDIGQTFAVTPKLFLRGDEILAPSVNLSGYFGGIQYALPTAKILAKTNLDPAHFQFYVNGSAGQARVTVGNNPVTTHFAALAGGGANYDPAGTGKFSINLFEVRWAKFPGLSNSTVLVSSGLKIGF